MHKIMIEKDMWYITVEDAEKLLKECNKEIERLTETIVQRIY